MNGFVLVRNVNIEHGPIMKTVSFIVLQFLIRNTEINHALQYSYLNCNMVIINHDKSAKRNDPTASFTATQYLYPDKLLTTDQRFE